jgi:hypothetical protein
MTIPITTSCHGCGTEVEGVMHVMLCDGCLDERLAQPERAPDRPAGSSGDHVRAQELAVAEVLSVTTAMEPRAATPAVADSRAFIEDGDARLSHPDGSGHERVAKGSDGTRLRAPRRGPRGAHAPRRRPTGLAKAAHTRDVAASAGRAQRLIATRVNLHPNRHTVPHGPDMGEPLIDRNAALSPLPPEADGNDHPVARVEELLGLQVESRERRPALV